MKITQDNYPTVRRALSLVYTLCFSGISSEPAENADGVELAEPEALVARVEAALAELSEDDLESIVFGADEELNQFKCTTPELEEANLLIGRFYDSIIHGGMQP